MLVEVGRLISWVVVVFGAGVLTVASLVSGVGAVVVAAKVALTSILSWWRSSIALSTIARSCWRLVFFTVGGWVGLSWVALRISL